MGKTFAETGRLFSLTIKDVRRRSYSSIGAGQLER